MTEYTAPALLHARGTAFESLQALTRAIRSCPSLVQEVGYTRLSGAGWRAGPGRGNGDMWPEKPITSPPLDAGSAPAGLAGDAGGSPFSGLLVLARPPRPRPDVEREMRSVPGAAHLPRAWVRGKSGKQASTMVEIDYSDFRNYTMIVKRWRPPSGQCLLRRCGAETATRTVYDRDIIESDRRWWAGWSAAARLRDHPNQSQGIQGEAIFSDDYV
jgi:hypothetical protein